jgi:flagellar hook-associated protein 3 FlgL
VDMRVTSQSQVLRATANLQRQAAARNRTTDEMSSGIKLQKPSDNPTEFLIVTDAKSKHAELEGYVGSIAGATQFLNESVSTLTDANTLLTRVRTIASEANNSQNDQRQLESYAQEIDGILTRMIDIGNSSSDGRYLFAGAQTQTKPFSIATTNASGTPSAIGYSGSIERSRANIGPDQTVDTQYDGSRIFQNADGDVYKSLIDLRDQLRDTSLTNSQRTQALTTTMSNLEKSSDSILQAVGEQSTSLENLQALSSRFTDVKLSKEIRSNELEATDYSQAVVSYQSQETLYQALMATTSKMFSTSLLNFLQ